jgi:hypothetical protein
LRHAQLASALPRRQVPGRAQTTRGEYDCAITWTHNDGKVYCFSSESSKKTFLQDPNGNLQKAHEFVAAASVEATDMR